MRVILIVFVTLLIAGCSENKQPPAVIRTTIDSSGIKTEEEVGENEQDCVFDTSAYSFTTEALLKHFPKLPYRWDTTNRSAHALLANGDSIMLQIGGCNHFGFHATLLTSVPFTDTTELLDKTKWLAKTFFYHGFDEKIPAVITAGHFRLVMDDENSLSKTYTFEDPDTTVTNLILDGFTFEKRGARTSIDLTAYIN